MTLSSHCSDATWEAEIYSLLPGRNSSLHSPAELVITTELGEEGRPLSRCSDNIWLLRGTLLLLGSWGRCLAACQGDPEWLDVINPVS